MFSYLTRLDCSGCDRRYDPDQVLGTCECGAPLLCRYDLAAAGQSLTPAALAGRKPTLWRYHEVLPVRDPARVVSLGEGMTPLVDLPRYGAAIGVSRLLMKDEGALPTGSFKARGATTGVSRAAELGVLGVAMPTNGNAGAAWATYAARAGLRCVVAMPVDAPAVTRAECAETGAELVLVDGLINDAGRMVGEYVADHADPLQDVSTLREPYRLEGKKTMGYELFEQLGWRVPDVIVYPTGGGVGLIGIHKALAEARELGLLTGRSPRLVVAQASGCAPIVRAFQAGATESEEWVDARTVAFGITVPKPLGDALILDAVRDTGGTAIAVDDTDLLAERAECARLDGAFLCPEGAAALAATRSLRRSGWIGADDEVVVLNTGAGLKYADTVRVDAPTLSVGERLADALVS